MSAKKKHFPIIVVLFVSAMILATGITSRASGTGTPEGNRSGPRGALAVASQLGPEINICCRDEDHQERTAVAYNSNHREHLVLWHNQRIGSEDISGARVPLSNEPVSWFAISTASNCTHPAVAYNRLNDEYLVVWQQFNTS